MLKNRRTFFGALFGLCGVVGARAGGSVKRKLPSELTLPSQQENEYLLNRLLEGDAEIKAHLRTYERLRAQQHRGNL